MNVVLVIGERPEQANALAERLGILGVEAIPCARDWKLAVRSLMTHQVSLILLDVDASEDSATFFVDLNDVCDVPVITRGVMADTDNVVSYLESGAADFVGRTTTLPVLAAKSSRCCALCSRTGALPLRLRSERSRLISEAARS